MYDEIKKNLEIETQKNHKHLIGEYSSIRAGKANPKMLDKVMVDYYGNPTPIYQMANISAPEARMILVSVWDISQIKEVSKAINSAKLGVNVSDDGKLIRLIFPQLTEERRKEFSKIAKNLAESAKISVRTARKKAMDELKNLKEKESMSEDLVKDAEDDLQKTVDRAVENIDNEFKIKDKEIMTV